MPKPSPNDIKNFKAMLFIFYTALPNSKEKTELERIIKGVNEHHDQDLRHLLNMIHDKITIEKRKQTTTRDKSLKIWANIMKIIIDYLSGASVENPTFHHGYINTNEQQGMAKTQGTTFAMAESTEENEEEGLA